MTTEYDLVASEYFSDRHQTCRGFDAATRATISHHLPFHELPNLPAIELCAGIGRLLEYTGHTALVHVDSSVQMLKLQPREPGLRVLADARQLPFVDEEFGLAAAFLCDPVLGSGFVDEVYRVLAPGGSFIFTTPSFEWAIALRGGLKHKTTFVTESGTQVTVPSNIFTRAQLLEMLCNFKSIKLTPCYLPKDCYPSGAILKASEVAGINAYDLPIVNLVSCRK